MGLKDVWWSGILIIIQMLNFLKDINFWNPRYNYDLKNTGKSELRYLEPGEATTELSPQPSPFLPCHFGSTLPTSTGALSSITGADHFPLTPHSGSS